MIEEKKDNRAGYGQARFVIHGRGFLELERAAVLRPRYNEYPERFPLDPQFPEPGRRGASRPPTVTRGAVGGGDGELPVVGRMVPPIYPEPRPRGDGGIVTNPLNPAPATLNGCDFGGGDFVFSERQAVAAGTDVGFVTSFTTGPIRVTQVGYWASPAGPLTTVRSKVLVSDENDVTGVYSSSGLSVTAQDIQFGDFLPFSTRIDVYPQKIFNFSRLCFKFLFRNNTAGAVDFATVVSFERLRVE